MKNFNLSVGALALSALMGCSQMNAMDAFEGDETQAVTEQELSSLVAPEPKSKSSDYRAYSRTYRLYGVQGEGESRYATLANKRDWSTFDVKVGDLFGRNWKVASIGEDSIELSGPAGRARIAAGRDATIREIRHRIDRVVTYAGKHRYLVNAGSVELIRGRYGVGAQSEGRSGVFPEDAVELTQVDERGLLGRLGFKAGDLIFAVENARFGATQDALDALADRFQDRAAGMFTVRVFRNGSSQDLQFEIR